ncbi:hypothetical protein [Teichococcus aestuarii]|uniref:hypothetical protein n=1 Tax=Teichococcus aestuarii TaxID=568898 RepID=UPI00361E7E8F
MREAVGPDGGQGGNLVLLRLGHGLQGGAALLQSDLELVLCILALLAPLGVLRSCGVALVEQGADPCLLFRGEGVVVAQPGDLGLQRPELQPCLLDLAVQ